MLADRSVDPVIGQPVRVRSVVVVRKTTAVESIAARGDRKMQHAIALGDPLADRVKLSHSEHVRSAEIVEDVLKKAVLPISLCPILGGASLPTSIWWLPWEATALFCGLPIA